MCSLTRLWLQSLLFNATVLGPILGAIIYLQPVEPSRIPRWNDFGGPTPNLRWYNKEFAESRKREISHFKVSGLVRSIEQSPIDGNVRVVVNVEEYRLLNSHDLVEFCALIHKCGLDSDLRAMYVELFDDSDNQLASYKTGAGMRVVR